MHWPGHDHRGQAAGFLGSSLAVGEMTGQVLVGVLIGLLATSELYLLIGAISLAGTAVFVALDAEPPSDPTPGMRESVRTIRTRHLPSRAAYATLRNTGLTWLYVGLSLPPADGSCCCNCSAAVRTSPAPPGRTRRRR